MFKGKCIIFSAPSGSGKTTLVKYLLNQKELNLSFSISATTRQRRDGEVQGKDYFFKTKSDFKKLINNSEFLEHEEVYDDVFYGTLESEVIKQLETQNVIFDIDVIGGIRLKEYFKNNALSIFVKAPSVKELKKRLSSRNKDSNESIETRIQKAQKEIEKESKFDLSIINDDLDLAKKESLDAVQNFLSK
ncbi:guanylate kinase [Flavobacteriaceae bacterium]|jgi:guanylate kinase|nr:guanylate kinase [Flavobacteriaceae bacterium]MDA8999907.1 guanylate kinase [Flavobacteriaceae bacterium]MDA9176539.1 guanylate kinase [Flavobacteriaceae bacterium]MDB4601245.1 guanylate kinase [Flavobacteriaceae bacterium]MDC0354728.1 guanylate kinase [Flavobacteriaceae bacterium]|tara:strand:- start:4768 stop:5337 length:570 start_codon:yes stop_codon:yes gene_type:complete